ncbi:MAG: hypothetical protein JXB05_17590 [Myxococcaceae bacterium]|nr:hypothetical protein [Myxococcaceae bacterium]
MTSTVSLRTLRAPMALALSLWIVGQASASPYPYREALDRNSRASGLGRSEVPMLQRQPGRGARVVAEELFSRYRLAAGAINTGGEYTIEATADKIRYDGARGWYLQVLKDGTSVRYRNYPYLEEVGTRPVSEKLSNEQLEALGRAFITQELAAYVRMATNEQLEAFSSVHELQGVQEASGTAPMLESVVASTVNFSRTVDGLGIVGPGSKISIIFANDGTPVGFDFDWPTYAPTGQTQQVLDVSSIHLRGSSVLPVDPFREGSTVMRFECGYYDGGARRMDASTPVQAACAYHHVVLTVGDPVRNRLDPTDGLDTAAYIGLVPAGAIVSADPRWPEAMVLCTDDTRCGVRPAPLPAPDSPPPSTGESPEPQ